MQIKGPICQELYFFMSEMVDSTFLQTGPLVCQIGVEQVTVCLQPCHLHKVKQGDFCSVKSSVTGCDPDM